MDAIDDRPRRERRDEALIRAAVRFEAARSRLLRPGATAAVLVVTLAGVGAVLREAEVPNAETWTSGEPLAAALVVLLALGYVTNVLVVIGYRRLLRRSDQDAQLYKACRDLAALVDRATPLSREAIAVHVWSVRGLPGIRRLERRATFVPGERQPSAITWRKGKGVLGRCWADNAWVLADLEPLASAETEEAFYAIPREERFLFNWQEARATSQYTAVLAWPLRGGPENARRVVGCLSLDAQSPGAAGVLDQASAATRGDFNAHVAVCEAILSKD